MTFIARKVPLFYSWWKSVKIYIIIIIAITELFTEKKFQFVSFFGSDCRGGIEQSQSWSNVNHHLASTVVYHRRRHHSVHGSWEDPREGNTRRTDDPPEALLRTAASESRKKIIQLTISDFTIFMKKQVLKIQYHVYVYLHFAISEMRFLKHCGLIDALVLYRVPLDHKL